MAELSIRPIAGTKNRVIVQPAAAETKTSSEIIIPDTAQEKPQQGVIVAVGDDADDGKPTVKVGDNVLYGKYAGTEFKYDGKDYLIMRESDIFAIV
ncbi:MAG: co-chaperone GroES [Bacteroidota bacterium]|nr:co-chaperone GroES [Bacteroidota bacterium]